MVSNIKRVAIIGAGPAGAISIDALQQEKVFDVIRVFERSAGAGGIWVGAGNQKSTIPSLRDLIELKADRRVEIPRKLPAFTQRTPEVNNPQKRYSDSQVYPELHSNIDSRIMSFTQEPFPDNPPDLSNPTPFRKASVIRGWVDGLFDRKGYRDHVEFNTTVELAEKVGEDWVLTLRKATPEGEKNYWWQEIFDAVIVASGHYSVPNFPLIPGIFQFDANFPGAVQHSKLFRSPKDYQGKKVVVVGASISATDITSAISGIASTPVYASIREPHPVFGVVPFEHPQITLKPTISHFSTSPTSKTVFFSDGTKLDNVDHVILATGYSFSLPWLPSAKVINRRIQGTYLHIFKQEDPTLTFVGGVSAGFTFRVFEWQAVLVARFLAGRAKLPPIEEQKRWETDRLAVRGDGLPFYKVAPDFEEYFETLRALAGVPAAGVPGRVLPKWDPAWLEIQTATIQGKLEKWRKEAEKARRSLEKNAGQRERAKL